MKRTVTHLVVLIAAMIGLVRSASAADAPPINDFANKIDLGELRALSLQDRLTIKTWDTFARQMIASITGRSTLDGQQPLYTLLDIAFRGEAYTDRNIIKIKNAQLRLDLKAMPGLDPTEAERIRHEGTVSLAFWRRDDVQRHIQTIQQDAVWKSESIGEIQQGAGILNAIITNGPSLSLMPFIPPAEGTDKWQTLAALHGNIQIIAEAFAKDGHQLPYMAGFDDAKLGTVFASLGGLREAWVVNDVAAAQTQIDKLAQTVPTMSARYPSASKRKAEVLYNKLYKLTLPGAALYFVAFTLFVVAAYSAAPRLRTAGVAFMVLGLILHTVGIAIRWWLDQKSTDSWFYSIPIKNQFESVMMSAWFGIIVGLALEVWRKKSLFGAAACFVGWMSLIALFTVPYVFGKDIGNEIGRSQGILMSYWLYIHVTLATASYALIGMSFLLGTWWLIRYATAPNDVRAMAANRLSADAVEPDMRPDALALSFVSASPTPAIAGGVDVPAEGNASIASRTVAPSRSISASGMAGGTIGAGSIASTSMTPAGMLFSKIDAARALLARLDACNLVILQLAFWILGVAIVCGAIWADVSWGRPWGWDAKETFALVTWIVYLIILHVRLVTTRKAFWTAILTIAGFFVMLFNWVGVNYFLVGLHSYA